MRTLALRAAPLYAIFFLWSFGTGAQQFARPQFAAELGAPVFFVTLIAASNSVAWLVAGPLTGVLSDRWGRKPLIIAGNALRGVTTLAQSYAPDYVTFFALEFLGGIGVSMWVTGASIVMADITSYGNRGRAVAVRSLATRVGAVLGPLVAGLLTAALSLRSVFLFNAATKLAIHVVLQFLVHETRPHEPQPGRPASSQGAAASPSPAAGWRLVRVLWPLAVATFALSATGFQGVLGALLPLRVVGDAGLEPVHVGNLMSAAAAAALVSSLVAGPVMDRWGRRPALVVSLALLGAAVCALAPAMALPVLMAVALAYGAGEGAALGAAEVYAMDAAPVARRGTFLGNWSLIRNLGGAGAPVAIGALAQWWGTGAGFLAIGGMVLAAALALGLWGVEPRALREPRGSALP